jgi:septal ring factor EnvC (AmiA/AmiB activator)
MGKGRIVDQFSALSSLILPPERSCVYKVFSHFAESTFTFIACALTSNSFSHYSRRMENELSILEGKIEQLLRLVANLRDENVTLQENISVRDAQIMTMQEKLDSAKTRLEQLISHIPDDEEPSE